MDRISKLPEALILRILSLLPAQDVVATMFLSKRWQPLWTLVPKLMYDDSYQNIEYRRFSKFVDRSLLLHEAPVVETLNFKLGRNSRAVDIGVWTRTAVKRCVRELIIEIDCSSSTTALILPKSLCTDCTMLVTLTLISVILVDVSSSVSFPSLKGLGLVSVKYPDDEFVKRLLSNCPVLEALAVERNPDENVTIFTIIVPSLKSLFLRESSKCVRNDARGFVIDAPSLEFFDIRDHRSGFCVFENNMPKIIKADVDVLYSHPGKILSSITSVKHLYLCLRNSKDLYPVGSVFHHLVHLKLCTCETEWLNLLMCVLRDSPKLQTLKLEQCHNHMKQTPRQCWLEPNSVPECLLTSLETLEWVNYEGTVEEKEVAAFILRNGSCLKKAFTYLSTCIPVKLWSFSHEGSSNIWLLSQCLIRIFGYVET
ncbi:putative FBD-associated F-box protein [Cardamine amara subsp. amara]|uniref:FBD-associated F-box protein n=1 Tax=Cardamine amara subsp. amara TaxID=228776 RepID=A0ABD0ZL54_CARAN